MKDELMKSYERSFKGKHPAAACIDAFFFAALTAFAVFVVSGKPLSALFPRILAAALTFVSVVIIFDLLRKIGFHNHVSALRFETERALFREKLLCMDRESFVSAVSGALSSRGEELFVFQRSEPLCPDDIFGVIRASGGKSSFVVSVSDLRGDAKELISSPGFQNISFMTAESIPQLAELFPPTQEEIDRRITERSSFKPKKRFRPGELLQPSRAAKYLLLGGILFAASFISSRPLYLRFIASITLSAAAMIFIKDPVLRRPKKSL